MVDFDIKDTLKNHYIFEYELIELLDLFRMLFEKEKKELLKKFEDGLDKLYGELNFSPTIYNISDIIVYKYFNDNLSFAQKAFILSSKFKSYPFQSKINELES